MATKTRTGIAPWKKLLGEAEQLRGQSGINAHRRATILVELSSDEDFRSEMHLTNDDAIYAVLDGLVEDLSLTFAELRNMLQEFPSPDDWADGKLRTLYDRTVEMIRSRRTKRDEDLPQRTRRTVTLREYEEVCGDKQDLEARLRYVEGQYAEAVAEIQRLKLENAELRGRIVQLEAMLRERGC